MKRKLTIVGEPVPKARPRLGANGNVYTPRESREYEDLVAWCSKTLPRYQGLLALNVSFFCSPRPKLPDLDNLIKSLLDGLQKGGVFADDVQVTTINASRIPELEQPRVELILIPLEPP